VNRAEAIRAALATCLRQLDGVQVSEYLLGNPTAPGFEIDIDPEGVNWDQAMGRGLDEWWFLVRGFVAQATDVGAQKKRDEWIGTVKALIEADRTLGGACQACRVVKTVPRSFGTATATNTTYTGAEWRVKVMATL